jgi:hypothetical protein
MQLRICKTAVTLQLKVITEALIDCQLESLDIAAKAALDRGRDDSFLRWIKSNHTRGSRQNPYMRLAHL